MLRKVIKYALDTLLRRIYLYHMQQNSDHIKNLLQLERRYESKKEKMLNNMYLIIFLNIW